MKNDMGWKKTKWVKKKKTNEMKENGIKKQKWIKWAMGIEKNEMEKTNGGKYGMEKKIVIMGGKK